jgi:ferredoxin
MIFLKVATLLPLTAFTVFLVALTVSSVAERKPRAALISSITVLGLLVLFLITILTSIADLYQLAISFTLWTLLLSYFLPLSRPSTMDTSSAKGRVDERDTVFAREEYEAGSDRYQEYYNSNPQYKDTDDRIRELPQLLAEGGYFYDPERAAGVKATFGKIKSLTTQVDGVVASDRIPISAVEFTAQIKKRILLLGAVEVGVGFLNPVYVYSHVGRGPEPFGSTIDLRHKFAIVFTLEMEYEAVQEAPDLPITEEAARNYLLGAQISVKIAEEIRSMGYPARAHISDSNYQIMLPPVAQDAGLGELSRMGYIISQKHGPRVRLGAVTTDIPLIIDQPVSFGVQDFCKTCLKCAENCPSNAIPTGDKVEVRGVLKWPLNTTQCLKYWRLAGTDCGLCMKVCPYSHPVTFVHNVVRSAIVRSRFARRVSIWGDDLLYGRNPRPRLNRIDEILSK